MTHQNRELEPIESLLVELADAERAGVFKSTATQPIPVVEQPFKTLVLRPRVALPIAACLAVAIGSWTMMFRYQLTSIRDRDADSAPVVALASHTPIARCLTGPTHPEDTRDCDENDVDADGDIDLEDFRAQQIALAVRSR